MLCWLFVFDMLWLPLQDNVWSRLVIWFGLHWFFGLVSWLFSLIVFFSLVVTVFLIIVLIDCLFSFDFYHWLSLYILNLLFDCYSLLILICRFFFVWLHFFLLILLFDCTSPYWFIRLFASLSPLILLFWCFFLCLLWFN